jgi:hypothetical protein
MLFQTRCNGKAGFRASLACPSKTPIARSQVSDARYHTPIPMPMPDVEARCRMQTPYTKCLAQICEAILLAGLCQPRLRRSKKNTIQIMKTRIESPPPPKFVVLHVQPVDPMRGRYRIVLGGVRLSSDSIAAGIRLEVGFDLKVDVSASSGF